MFGEIDYDAIDEVMTEIFNHVTPTTELGKELARENLRRYPDLMTIFGIDKDEDV